MLEKNKGDMKNVKRGMINNKILSRILNQSYIILCCVLLLKITILKCGTPKSPGLLSRPSKSIFFIFFENRYFSHIVKMVSFSTSSPRSLPHPLLF